MPPKPGPGAHSSKLLKEAQSLMCLLFEVDSNCFVRLANKAIDLVPLVRALNSEDAGGRKRSVQAVQLIEKIFLGPDNFSNPLVGRIEAWQIYIEGLSRRPQDKKSDIVNIMYDVFVELRKKDEGQVARPVTDHAIGSKVEAALAAASYQRKLLDLDFSCSVLGLLLDHHFHFNAVSLVCTLSKDLDQFTHPQEWHEYVRAKQRDGTLDKLQGLLARVQDAARQALTEGSDEEKEKTDDGGESELIRAMLPEFTESLMNIKSFVEK